MKVLLHCGRCDAKKEVSIEDIIAKRISGFVSIPDIYCDKCLEEGFFYLVCIDIILAKCLTEE